MRADNKVKSKNAAIEALGRALGFLNVAQGHLNDLYLWGGPNLIGAKKNIKDAITRVHNEILEAVTERED